MELPAPGRRHVPRTGDTELFFTPIMTHKYVGVGVEVVRKLLFARRFCVEALIVLFASGVLVRVIAPQLGLLQEP